MDGVRHATLAKDMMVRIISVVPAEFQKLLDLLHTRTVYVKVTDWIQHEVHVAATEDQAQILRENGYVLRIPRKT